MSFLVRPQIHKIRIVSWNINGITTKLEKYSVQILLNQFDIIGLNEIKTGMRISFPGFIAYKSRVRGGVHRGGTVLLIRRALQQQVLQVDTGIEDQI